MADQRSLFNKKPWDRAGCSEKVAMIGLDLMSLKVVYCPVPGGLDWPWLLAGGVVTGLRS